MISNRKAGKNDIGRYTANGFVETGKAQETVFQISFLMSFTSNIIGSTISLGLMCPGDHQIGNTGQFFGGGISVR